MLLVVMGFNLPVEASGKGIESKIARSCCVADSIINDTTKLIIGDLPLKKSKKGYRRPRFDTFHLVMGFGWHTMNLSALKRLGVNISNNNVMSSFYGYVPLSEGPSHFYIMAGYDAIFNEAAGPSYKTLLLYQRKEGIILGVGGGSSALAIFENVIIDASQSHALFAFGFNISPQRVDLLMTIPISTPLTTRFEGGSYSIRPAGIQINLLTSLR